VRLTHWFGHNENDTNCPVRLKTHIFAACEPWEDDVKVCAGTRCRWPRLVYIQRPTNDPPPNQTILEHHTQHPEQLSSLMPALKDIVVCLPCQNKPYVFSHWIDNYICIVTKMRAEIPILSSGLKKWYKHWLDVWGEKNCNLFIFFSDFFFCERLLVHF